MSGSHLVQASHTAPAVANLVGPVLAGNLGSGNSVIFNGRNNYLQVTNTGATTGFYRDGDPYTIEFFMKYSSTQDASASDVTLISFGTSPFTGGMAIQVFNDNIYYHIGGALKATRAITAYKDVWRHIAICRNGDHVTRIFVDGVKQGVDISSDSGALTNLKPLVVGAYLQTNGNNSTNGSNFTGLVTNVRWTDTCVYTGNFTRPTSPLQATQSANPYGGSNTAAITGVSVKVLIVCTNGAAYDSSTYHKTISGFPPGNLPAASLDGPF
jgi:hypothetical protein